MNTNLPTSYVALQADRNRLTSQAERGWQAERAAASRSRAAIANMTRQWTGAMLVLLGQRMPGTSRMTVTGSATDAMGTFQSSR